MKLLKIIVENVGLSIIGLINKVIFQSIITVFASRKFTFILRPPRFIHVHLPLKVKILTATKGVPAIKKLVTKC